MTTRELYAKLLTSEVAGNPSRRTPSLDRNAEASMNVQPLQNLADQWRTEAELFRRRGMEDSATLVESCATDLEAGIREWELETLTLGEAAVETGLAYDTLQKKVSRGNLPNVGSKRAPRVRRCDLFGTPRPRLVENESLSEAILRRRAAG